MFSVKLLPKHLTLEISSYVHVLISLEGLTTTAAATTTINFYHHHHHSRHNHLDETIYFQSQAPFQPPPQAPRENDFFQLAPTILPASSAPPLPPHDYFLLPEPPIFFPELKRKTKVVARQQKLFFQEISWLANLKVQLRKNQNKKKKKIEVDEDVITSLKKAEEILNKEFEFKHDRKSKEEQELIDEFNHEEINEGKVPTELEFYISGKNKNFFLKCPTWDLDVENKNKLSWLSNFLINFFFKISYQSILKQVMFTTKTWTQTNLSTISFINNRTKQKKLTMWHSALMIPFEIILASFLTIWITAPLIDLIC